MLLAALANDPQRRPVMLLVEDHDDTRAMYAEFLGADFEVRQAADGRTALDVMRTSRPDIVITDLSLPGVDGFELMALMRQDPVLQSVPIICLSGHGGHAHDTRARAAGCDRVLQKPCMPDALAAAALELLRDRGSRSTAP